MEKKKPVSKKATAKPAKAAVAPVAAADSTASHKPHRKMLVGVVVSNKMKKTIVVNVDRAVRHSLYKKYVKKSRKFKAHDENNTAQMGDLVQIVETRPLSRDKRWALHTVLRRSATGSQLQLADENN